MCEYLPRAPSVCMWLVHLLCACVSSKCLMRMPPMCACPLCNFHESSLPCLPISCSCPDSNVGLARFFGAVGLLHLPVMSRCSMQHLYCCHTRVNLPCASATRSYLDPPITIALPANCRAFKTLPGARVMSTCQCGTCMIDCQLPAFCHAFFDHLVHVALRLPRASCPCVNIQHSPLAAC